jgi:hypothetical protein
MSSLADLKVRLYRASATTLSAASPIESAVAKFRPLSLSIR